jgi:hypothetical protein
METTMIKFLDYALPIFLWVWIAGAALHGDWPAAQTFALLLIARRLEQRP